MQVSATIFHQSLHLAESQLEPETGICQFCQHTDQRSIYPLQSEPDVSLLLCNKCQAISASRMPSASALDSYYSTYYTDVSQEKDASQVTFDKPIRLARRLAGWYSRYCSGRTPTILDFGGGDGTISLLSARLLLNEGAQTVKVIVVDHNQNNVVSNDKRIHIESTTSLESVNQRFEFVIASAVIEHFPNAHELVCQLLDKTNPGGLFVLCTHAKHGRSYETGKNIWCEIGLHLSGTYS